MTPLVPAHVDLRDFPYMPLEVVRLRDSDLMAIVSDAGFRAAVMLWCVAWHQLPAASLPDDDRLLCRLAGFGKDMGAWLDVKEDALHNFVKCDDGRLYHTTIAEKALEAWEAKQRQRERTEAARNAKLLKAREADSGRRHKISVTENVTGSKGREGKGIESATTDPDGSAAAAKPPLPPDFRELCEKAAGKAYAKGFGKIAALVEAGVSVEERILPMIRTVAADLAKEGLNVSSWGYFATAIADETREPGPPVAATPELIWCPQDSPEFAKGNRARALRGEKPLNAIPVPSRGGAKGIFHEARDLAGVEGGQV